MPPEDPFVSAGLLLQSPLVTSVARLDHRDDKEKEVEGINPQFLPKCPSAFI